MIENVPAYVPAFFILTTLAAVAFLFYVIIDAAGRTRLRYVIPTIVTVWMIVQSSLSKSAFYQNTEVFPPRIFAFGASPALVAVVAACLILRRDLIDRLSLRTLTLLHTIRVPVEITLYWLAVERLIPDTMTFAGRNFDVLSGLTAPLVYYFAFRGRRTNRPLLLIWNCAALLLLINIVALAILSFPSPLQAVALEQPNRAVTYFPFIWLPTVVVPIVFFAHLAAIIKLTRSRAD
jgi:hypothetical protein